ncbi:uncharacterized protein LOC115004968 [Cottoperca gobio]|uniref:Uncharacterized protein LOC115004968 n=1 Tax=Cottoperca gobio TaxID=56716 RepID=A0A6J2PAQ4_COTGO|nr:uncharacterized protein C6orf226 homolog [Cottoperca gobio]
MCLREMEAVFLRFDSFDFEADRRFQDGLKDLKKSKNSSEEKLHELKLFFYNRFVEPIDRHSYTHWSCASPRGTARDCDTTDTRTEPSADTQQKQLSFAEVMRLVQDGQEVPGGAKLEVKPTNQNPTESQMERRLKPWETCGS